MRLTISIALACVALGFLTTWALLRLHRQVRPAFIEGIDVNQWHTPSSWRLVKQSERIHFVYVKATDGLSVDSKFFPNYEHIQQVGIPIGTFHFMRFGQDALKQAEHFLRVIAGHRGQLLPMVDVEDRGRDGASATAAIAELHVFVSRVEQTLNGKRMIIYSSQRDWHQMLADTRSFADRPYFIADYHSKDWPVIHTGFDNWTIWQWSHGPIPGVECIDRDYLNPASKIDTLFR